MQPDCDLPINTCGLLAPTLNAFVHLVGNLLASPPSPPPGGPIPIGAYDHAVQGSLHGQLAWRQPALNYPAIVQLTESGTSFSRCLPGESAIHKSCFVRFCRHSSQRQWLPLWHHEFCGSTARVPAKLQA